MREITLEELLEAGCHFGHQVTRGNPKARDFIFEERDGIHIIDLAKTKEGLEEALGFIKELASDPQSTMVIVGTKRQASSLINDAFKKIQDANTSEGLFYVTQRWIGGLLTNFSEVSKNFLRLSELDKTLTDPTEKTKFTKKELGDFQKEKQKLEGLYGGIKNIKKIPDALFIVDARLEDLAVKEALKTGVTTVALVDTNADPNVIDYPIPANDDAVGSIGLIMDFVAETWIEGRKKGLGKKETAAKTEEKKSAKLKKEDKETKKEKPKTKKLEKKK